MGPAVITAKGKPMKSTTAQTKTVPAAAAAETTATKKATARNARNDARGLTPVGARATNYFSFEAKNDSARRIAFTVARRLAGFSCFRFSGSSKLCSAPS